MAYMSQEKKKALAPGIKAVLKKYGMKGSISVQHHSALVVTLKSGDLEFAGKESSDVNVYWIDSHYEGAERDFLKELHAAMNGSDDGSVANHDNSDIMTDYFDVGWYTYIKFGKWPADYVWNGAKAAA
jgi:hypothetical protein